MRMVYFLFLVFPVAWVASLKAEDTSNIREILIEADHISKRISWIQDNVNGLGFLLNEKSLRETRVTEYRNKVNELNKQINIIQSQVNRKFSEDRNAQKNLQDARIQLTNLLQELNHIEFVLLEKNETIYRTRLFGYNLLLSGLLLSYIDENHWKGKQQYAAKHDMYLYMSSTEAYRKSVERTNFMLSFASILVALDVLIVTPEIFDPVLNLFSIEIKNTRFELEVGMRQEEAGASSFVNFSFRIPFS